MIRNKKNIIFNSKLYFILIINNIYILPFILDSIKQFSSRAHFGYNVEKFFILIIFINFHDMRMVQFFHNFYLVNQLFDLFFTSFRFVNNFYGSVHSSTFMDTFSNFSKSSLILINFIILNNIKNIYNLIRMILKLNFKYFKQNIIIYIKYLNYLI